MTKWILRASLLVSAFLLISIAIPLTARAQRPVTIITYAAKFVCGKSDERIISPGQYFTGVNVHNPSPFNSAVYLKRFAIALPEERPGQISEFASGTLKPDEAMTIDCENIYRHTQVPPGSFLEGFALIYSLTELDVVPVYTAGHVEVEAFHTERVPPRRLVLPRTNAMARRLINQQSLQ
jgi:hypothetical protein